MAYILNVNISSGDLMILKDNKSSLCIAKKVSGQYTVVWSGNHEYLRSNEFRWVDEYQVYGVRKFHVGALVQATTNKSNIGFGQTCTLDSGGTMNSATGPINTSGEFYVQNDYGRISVGVESKLNGQFVPAFVSPNTIDRTAAFEPTATVQVWFSQNMVTGTMILQPDSAPIEVTYSGGTTEGTVSFTDGRWIME